VTPEQPETLAVARQIIELFTKIGIEYHLGGSYASSIHGTPRQTQDVDLVADLDRSHIGPLIEGLAPEFFAQPETARRAVEAKSSFNVLHLATGVKVDIFVLGDSDFDRSEFARARPQRIYAAGRDAKIRVKSPEDTILRKLHWYRLGGETSERQWTDVLGCVNTQGESLDLDYLRDWATELGVADLLRRALDGSASETKS
jgi:hypothetical protein